MGQYDDVNRIKKDLLKERERFSLFLSLDTGCFFEYDEDADTLVFSNHKFFGQLSDRVVNKCRTELLRMDIIVQEDRQKVCDFITGETDGECEFRIVQSKSDFLWCLAKTVRFQNSDGSVVKMGCVKNIDREKKEEEELIRRREKEPVTGFLRPAKLKEKIQCFLEQETNIKQHAFYLMDIDNFKKLTERFGRLFGNTVLANISDEIQGVLERGDIVGRVGDDEFVIFIKNAVSLKKVETIAQYMQDACQRTYAGEQDDFAITACVGVVLCSNEEKDYEVLFKKADTALHEAKEIGEGTYRIYDSSMIQSADGGYYNQYTTEFEQWEVDNRGNNFGQEMIRFAFDIMSTTKDVESAMHLLLEKMGKQYAASYVSIYERGEGDADMHCTYYWCRESGRGQIVPDFTEKKQLTMANRTREESFVFEISDMEKEDSNYPETDILQQAGTKAFLECAFYEDGAYKGCVCIGNSLCEHEWTEEEKHAFVMITDIISSYLLKLRVSERVEERLEYARNYDFLTGIATLQKLKADAKELLKKNQTTYAVIYTDIMNFKYINDRYGYDTGDNVLRDFAFMLSRQLKEGSLCARVSADNFVYMMPCEEQQNAYDFVMNFCNQFQSMQRCKNIAARVVVVSGICMMESMDDVSLAIDNANMVRKSLKGTTSKNACRFYSVEMSEKIRLEQEIEAVMTDALANREFQVYLQPKIGLTNNQLAGAEALVRWNHEGRQLKPNEFIPLFEKNGFVVELDFFVYEEVCKMLRMWKEDGRQLVPVSVNVSRIHLLAEDFIDKLMELVKKYDIEPAFLELELTESIFLDNAERALDIMRQLKELGFSISIDDFGAGYSSLNLLKDMSTDVIKLDKEFFGHGDMQKEEQIIVSNIINMAKELNMKVLSEGIETEGQSEFLKNVSCDMAQGYYFAKPMPAKEFEKML